MQQYKMLSCTIQLYTDNILQRTLTLDTIQKGTLSINTKRLQTNLFKRPQTKASNLLDI
jgi:hypothetical protein